MAYIPKLPVTIVGKIVGGSVSVNTTYNNVSSLYNGYPYTYNVTLELVPVLNSDDRITPDPYTYDTNQIEVGMWVGQPNGLMYQITAINGITSTSLIDVTIKDVDLFNTLSDTTFAGSNAPLEEAFGVIFDLSEDGDPVLNGLELQRGNLPDINYWINDFYARFQYRNLISTYYNNDPENLVYSSGYTVGQLVYLDATGQFQVVDDTNQSELEKAFGVITSVNEPEDGNMTVKPFGKITGGLNLSGVGNIGDVLYYETAGVGTNYVTATKPGSNPLPVYIKISDTTASLIGWPLTPGGSGGTGSSGTSGYAGTSGISGVNGVDGTSGSTGSSGSSGFSGAVVTGATLTNTVLELQNSDNTTAQVDFDPASDVQTKEGVTTHGFIFLDENSFTGNTFNIIFTTSSKTDSIQVKELQTTDFTAKLTYVVLDVVNTGSTENYIVVLPPFVSANDESRVIKFVTKRNNLNNANDLMVGSKWASGGSQDRIIAANINTKLTNDGYFFPLETLESVELLYDGYDWLVVNTQKQQYVQATPVNYLLFGTNGTAGSFKNRDINNLL